MVKLYYKMDKKISEEIIKCSRCGLCMDVCPIYHAKGTETALLRGKFLQLLGLIRGDLKWSKKIAYNLDLCLACGKCKKACPSGIDAVYIFSFIKNKYQTPFERFFYSAPLFKFKLFWLKILYLLKYFPKNIKRKKIKSNKGEVHFKGCASKSINVHGFNFDNVGKFSCCALPYYLKGRFDLYEKYKKRNIKLIKEAKKVIFDCATCYDTVLNYEGLESEQKDKLVYFTDYYKSKNLSLKDPLKVTFHKPCHLNGKVFSDILEILKSIKNLEFVDYEEMDECCGFSGDFFTRHIKTSSILSETKIKNISKTKADIVLTTCPTCLWSLKYGIKLLNTNLKACDLAEFLDVFCEIKD